MTRVPHHLRVEHLDEALGIDVRVPRLSWQLPALATRQEAYRLEVGAWTQRLGRVARVRARALRRARRSSPAIAWSGESRCAATSALGVVRAGRGGRWASSQPDDWSAQWIAPVEADPLPAAGRTPGVRAAHPLRGRRRPSRSARIYATAHGLYELFVTANASATRSSRPVSRPTGRTCRCRPSTWHVPPRAGRQRAARRAVRRLVPRQGRLHA